MMAVNKQVFSPGSYWIVNKNTTTDYELRVDYIWVSIPSANGYSFKVKENLFMPIASVDITVRRIADSPVFEGV
jgi:hypothetical protein